jgi:hypothetical protein
MDWTYWLGGLAVGGLYLLIPIVIPLAIIALPILIPIWIIGYLIWR